MKRKYLIPSLVALAVLSACSPAPSEQDNYVMGATQAASNADSSAAKQMEDALKQQDPSVKGVTIGKNDKGESTYMITREKADGTAEVVETPPVSTLQAAAQQQQAAGGTGSSTNSLVTGMLLGHLMSGRSGPSYGAPAMGATPMASGFTSRSYSNLDQARHVTNNAWQRQVDSHRVAAKASYVPPPRIGSSSSTSTRSAFSSGGRSSASSSSGG